MSLVTLEITPDGIAVLTLNDPERLNAMGPAMAVDFAARIHELELTPPRVLILRGEGRAFSAGGDLQMLEDKRTQTQGHNQQEMISFYSSFLDMLDLQVPLIACVQGHAVGAGFCLACACDIRVAEEDAVFAAPFLQLGLFPGMGSTLFPPRVLGNLGHELLLTGRRMKADEAHRAGFLNRLVPSGQGLENALEIARQMLRSAPKITSQLLEVLRPSRLERLAYLEKEAALQGQSYLEEEFRLGLEAARAKRPSPFSGGKTASAE